jgi:GIY-YIG catalytic domain
LFLIVNDFLFLIVNTPQLFDQLNDKSYIGLSANLAERMRQYFSQKNFIRFKNPVDPGGFWNYEDKQNSFLNYPKHRD